MKGVRCGEWLDSGEGWSLAPRQHGCWFGAWVVVTQWGPLECRTGRLSPHIQLVDLGLIANLLQYVHIVCKFTYIAFHRYLLLPLKKWRLHPHLLLIPAATVVAAKDRHSHSNHRKKDDSDCYSCYLALFEFFFLTLMLDFLELQFEEAQTFKFFKGFLGQSVFFFL